MSLSGNLGFVSLDEVLRLLSRSNQQGSVNVTGDEIRGRIFVTNGGIVLATTWDDAGMRRHLLKSGMVDEAFIRSVEAGETTLASVAEKTGGALTDLIREMTVESLYQIGLKGDAFEVREGATTPYASPGAFDLETLLNDAKQRLSDWAEVSRRVGNLNAVIRFIRDLGDRDDVRIDRDSWRVLSEIGAGSSVAAVAEELGTTNFWTARIAGRLLDQELVEYHQEPVAPMTPEADTRDTGAPEHVEPVEESPSFDSHDDEATDPGESWWEEPADEAVAAEEPTEFEGFVEAEEELPEAEVFTDDTPDAQITAPEPAEERKSIFGAYKPAAPTPDTPAEEDTGFAPVADVTGDDQDFAPAEEVEEDTEAFLEKVFSELEETEEEPESEGYGLLRRRRLGAIKDTDA